VRNITTKTVAAGFAEVDETVLFETAKTVTTFKPQLHYGGVRGSIIRYRKDENGNKCTFDNIDFRKLNPREGVEIELKTEALTLLFEKIQELKTLLENTGVQQGRHSYRIATDDELIITDENKARIIETLLDANLGEDVWEQLVQSNPDIATRLANSKLQEDRESVLKRFETMLNDDTLSEDNWQDFFEDNTWIFGYGLRYQILRVIQTQPNYGGTAINGKGGQRGDYLTATEAETKFTCLVEIKKPSTKLLRNEEYRNGAWGASKELAGAISQVQVNCAQWEITGARTEQNREQLENINTISPRGIVVIGKTDELEIWDKRNSFERFRREIHNPEIITYDELFARAKYIVNV
jgi:hypothetical protein